MSVRGDAILAVLEDIYTTGEQTLIGAGDAAQVLETRRILGETVGPRLAAAVEQLTGRCVRASLSQVHVRPDVAVWVFLLDQEVTGKDRADTTHVAR